MREFKPKIFYLIIACLLLVGGVVFAEMTGAVYKIESDSINMGGMEITSGNYGLDDTLGEFGAGDSGSANYLLSAGYRQMQETYISIEIGDDITMSPNLGGLTGGVSNGSTTLTVLTDSPGGYTMTLQALASPAMTSEYDQIDDYVPLETSPELMPDFTFQTVLSQAVFGYTVEGADIVDFFRDDGAICNVIGGGDTAEHCWVGLTTTPVTIAAGSANQPSGVTTRLRFRIGIGGSNMITEGDYTATTTITAVAL